MNPFNPDPKLHCSTLCFKSFTASWIRIRIIHRKNADQLNPDPDSNYLALRWSQISIPWAPVPRNWRRPISPAPIHRSGSISPTASYGSGSMFPAGYWTISDSHIISSFGACRKQIKWSFRQFEPPPLDIEIYPFAPYIWRREKV